ncbi:MAG: glycogen/starch/alpha-glucan phosphorylase [Oscillospiraceae bacterium]|nr:glycogen/starch/alpha-glucan phosphorylase [Oscillospiraceae bacterium]MDD7041185.1 glycogen/starch/alpha-glucan phosphorylase [Oscillospiraceae bacterium]MDY2610727.1 glycogen/starch/alpha-glucan phosphorylase [Oscillospiraceae bacterium]
MDRFSKAELKAEIEKNLMLLFSVEPEQASDDQFYKATALMVRNILTEKQKNFSAYTHSNGNKEVYYLSMEFLMGRSLKNSLYNLEIVGLASAALEEMGVKLERLYEYEPDPGLGNGGLGRLAACYLDGLASQDYTATGYCILYEYGIFKQKIIDGWQTELPDYWLPGGEIWLTPNPDQAIDVHFGGEVEEFWDYGYHHINYKNYNTVKAVPYDMPVSGYQSEGVSNLRLWKAVSAGIDMDSFNRGDYLSALRQNSMTEVISKVLYPNDSHMEGKLLRLRQQYFLVAASVGDIVNRHMSTYGTLDNLADKIAIHINDTHPTLAIPELMRILLDECGYTWERAWELTQGVFAYTNHTVMSEALEVWNEDLFKNLLPRIYQIICEINRRFCLELEQKYHQPLYAVSSMSIVQNRGIKMANLCVVGSHSVNGVSKLHSKIIQDDLFHLFYGVWPEKFTNVTNGIASRRWLLQANPRLTKFISSRVGEGYLKDFSQLSRLKAFADDPDSLKELAQVKRENKLSFSKFVQKQYGIALNPDSIFDAQVKRLHEYKRQHLNALHILYLMKKLRENPDLDLVPRTFIFGAKAAPGYYLAKQIIRLICVLQKEIENDPLLRQKLRIVYLEDYRVTLSELLTPACDVSEQISLAGTEASGTGNMKLMLGGAITLGTYDGANVEIHEQVGDENIMIFGMRTEEVDALRQRGYAPGEYYEKDPLIQDLINTLYEGISGSKFPEIADSLKNVDPYMVLADFRAYIEAQEKIQQLYRQPEVWSRMSLMNIAGSGVFCADRAVEEYAHRIWRLTK